MDSKRRDETYGGVGTGWEHAGIKGVMQEENKIYFGKYRRGLIQPIEEGGTRLYFVLHQNEAGKWVPLHEGSFAGLGEIVQEGGKFFAKVQHRREDGTVDPVFVSYPID